MPAPGPTSTGASQKEEPDAEHSAASNATSHEESTDSSPAPPPGVSGWGAKNPGENDDGPVGNEDLGLAIGSAAAVITVLQGLTAAVDALLGQHQATSPGCSPTSWPGSRLGSRATPQFTPKAAEINRHYPPGLYKRHPCRRAQRPMLVRDEEVVGSHPAAPTAVGPVQRSAWGAWEPAPTLRVAAGSGVRPAPAGREGRATRGTRSLRRWPRRRRRGRPRTPSPADPRQWR